MITLTTQVLGSLERDVMQLIWQHGPLTVPELHEHISDRAYTTVMTTAAKLAQKGMLVRQPPARGHASIYAPAVSRGALLAQIVEKACRDLAADADDRRYLQD